MNLIKSVGIFALVLGCAVLLVASYVSVNNHQLIIEPYALGVAAVLAGFICVKKSKED
ncbi:hypothetical protein OKW21_002655 [Catalinimonas alkaloidigena]|uniref:hypothetical protein n=1 Tax=Catalinimonas alkaloidigena TaxID=1075417 RepID=UPI002405C9E6|nr:hypothetical protein [Catalinimonas alkaloidigena]MDF9797392.1 hypothetical protein [Catalinimonas alkaloidigena]